MDNIFNSIFSYEELLDIRNNTKKHIIDNGDGVAGVASLLTKLLCSHTNLSSRFDPSRQIAVIWDIDDVIANNPALTDEEAMNVLRQVENDHDCEYGITWQTIDSAVAQLYPSKSGWDNEEE